MRIVFSGRDIDLSTYRLNYDDLSDIDGAAPGMLAFSWGRYKRREFLIADLWHDDAEATAVRDALVTLPGETSVQDIRDYLHNLADSGFRICGGCASFRTTNRWVDFGDGAEPACDECFSEYAQECPACHEVVMRSAMYAAHMGGENVRVCDSCRSSRFGTCWHCSTLVPDSETDSHCESSYEDDDDDDSTVSGCDCSECNRTRRNRNASSIHYYSYRPSPIFRGEPDIRAGIRGREFDAAPYMGFELEVVTPNGLHTAANKLLKGANEDVGTEGHLYLKDDSSIRGEGFEIVTHPMTLDYYMSKFPWGVIRDLRKADMIRSDDSCGMHVHLSRNAFSGQAHELRWLHFFYRNQKIMKALARRDVSYASFQSGGREAFATSVKSGEHLGANHYDAINRGNSATYEVRIFASTVFVNRIKANLQLIDATLEYTRTLKVAKVIKDGGFAFGPFVAWMATGANRKRYAELREQITQVVESRRAEFESRQKGAVNAQDFLAYGPGGYGDNIYSKGKTFVIQEAYGAPVPA